MHHDFVDADTQHRAVHPTLAAWSLMHLFAEASSLVFAALSTAGAGPASAAARSNINHLLEAMGPTGRSCQMMAFPSALAAYWTGSQQQHGVGNGGRSSSSSSSHVEDRLDAYWADCSRLYHIADSQLLRIACNMGIDSRPALASSYATTTATTNSNRSPFLQQSSPRSITAALQGAAGGEGVGQRLVLPSLPSLRLSPTSAATTLDSLRLSPISPPAPGHSAGGVHSSSTPTPMSVSLSAQQQQQSSNNAHSRLESPPTPALSSTRHSRTESLSSHGADSPRETFTLSKGFTSTEQDHQQEACAEASAVNKKPRISMERDQIPMGAAAATAEA